MLKICLFIFIFKVLEISLGTLRTFYTVKGKILIASITAFLEVLIWYFVAKEAIIIKENTIIIGIIYALGYAIGTVIGSLVANNFINGHIAIFVITKKNNDNLIDKIRKAGYGVSIIELKKDLDENPKEMLIVEMNKKYLKAFFKLIYEEDSKAFMFVNETKTVQNGFLK